MASHSLLMNKAKCLRPTQSAKVSMRRPLCVRASPKEDVPASASTPTTITTEMESPVLAAAAASSVSSTPAPSGGVMGFSGAAPEITNGRLAMLGFVSAVAAELSSGEGVLRQWADEPTLVNLTFVLFIAASLAPILLKGASGNKQVGPFTPSAEMLNGRAAMIGFAALIAVEAYKGSALF